MNKNTLTFKVLGVLGIFLSCALVTMGVVTMWLQYRSTMDLQTKNASNVTAIIIKDIQDYMMKGDAREIGRYAAEAKKNRFVRDLRIYNTEGKETGATGSSASDPHVMQALQSGKNVSYTAVDGGMHTLSIAAPLINEERCHQCHDAGSKLRGSVLVTTSIQDGYDNILAFAMKMIVPGIFFFFTLLGVIYFFFKKVIIQHVVLIADNVVEMANGNLTVSIDHKSSDEIGTLSSCINQLIQKFRGIIADDKLAADNVASGSRELSNIAANLSTAVNQQANLIVECDKLTQNVAENLDATEEMAISTTETVESTRGALSSFVENLNQAGQVIISESEKQVALAAQTQELAGKAGDIRSVLEIISDIADQTNLLALNASIEAARAGEMGRGFAVVADEVRQLASKTQSSLALINTSVKAVVSGVEHVCSANEVSAQRMREISGSTRRLIDSIGETSEQLKDAEDISSDLTKKCTYIATRTKQMIELMMQIMALTDQNRAVAGEVNGVSATLARKSDELRTALSHFRT
ncbi:methyl-accepting chemotaxis protein [Geobacter sp. SVR]|uniref:methyl-accepting chemotaxis protein n=1 Tax=Geobacter sp. SVR TaxID=2495594 RepID=UPI00143F0236|nr:methyl-accepting chemotaxis protein [Geobacter sp. SVR]BCS55870.1 methyl-accepting chemotaxis protein [Geobacter sp. SVR]GCF83874.1 methyl-accepting chemotaxis protein [Geobacter sp. SVR]